MVFWSLLPVAPAIAQIPRGDLLDALTAYRIREMGLLASFEAYKRMEATLSAEHENLSSALDYYLGLTELEIGDEPQAVFHFERCAQATCLFSDLPQLAESWLEILRLDEEDLTESIQSTDRFQRLIRVGLRRSTTVQTPMGESPKGLPPLTLSLPDPAGRAEYETEYHLHDPHQFTLLLTERLSNLRQVARNQPEFPRRLLWAWASLLSPQDRVPGVMAETTDLESFCVHFSQLTRAGALSDSRSLFERISKSNWDGTNPWPLRALTLSRPMPETVLVLATQAIQDRTSGKPLNPVYFRSRRKSELEKLSLGLAFYRETGWAFRERSLGRRRFELQGQPGVDLLRAREVLEAISTQSRGISDSPELDAIMRWDCLLRTGDWETFQRELTPDFHSRFPPLETIVDLARFIAGRFRTGDGVVTSAELAQQSREQFSETAENVLTGQLAHPLNVGWDVESFVAKREASEQQVPEPANRGHFPVWPLIGAGLAILGLLAVLAVKFRSPPSETQGGGHAW
ncbi:MAG: hypothetical protein KDA80_07550 [Planctomycetaceae bacterium]|nr:hypothetical protein [Planctomycetaceae bacterium]